MREVCLAGEVVEGSLVGAGGGSARGGGGSAEVVELGQAGAEQVVVGAGEEQGVLEAGVGDVVPDIQRYTETFRFLQAAALGPKESRDMLTMAALELDSRS
jgi:hypothetical protein